ncbi:hypothetical protein [Ligilactobacillus araffinosus]|uniref:hypothetical protein n=1 Tax=Ligilactobacillus araffinosus TaxID=147809 RepID=UPI00070F811B|nr:hypothetical protein [Ligilactobacillus araffinosus]
MMKKLSNIIFRFITNLFMCCVSFSFLTFGFAIMLSLWDLSIFGKVLVIGIVLLSLVYAYSQSTIEKNELINNIKKGSDD